MAKYNAKIEVTKEIDIWFEVPLFTGDVGNDIRLCFYENGQAYNMNGAQVTAVRADGEAVYDLAATEGNGAVITLKNNCYAQPGELSVYVTLTDAAGRAVTNGVLHFDVRRGYADGGGITADDRYPVLTELIDEVRELETQTGEGSVTTPKIANGAVTYDKLAGNARMVKNQTISSEAALDDIIDTGIYRLSMNGGTVETPELFTGYLICDTKVTGTYSETLQIGQYLQLNGECRQRTGTASIDPETTQYAFITWKEWKCLPTELDAVSTEKIADNAVTGEKIANNTITQDKLHYTLRSKIDSIPMQWTQHGYDYETNTYPDILESVDDFKDTGIYRIGITTSIGGVARDEYILTVIKKGVGDGLVDYSIKQRLECYDWTQTRVGTYSHDWIAGEDPTPIVWDAWTIV